jgi:hypothetical protein
MPRHDIVVVGASAGAFDALKQLHSIRQIALSQEALSDATMP